MLWKSVPGFTDYEVSECGDLRHGAVVLKPEKVHGNGRKRFSISRNGCVFRIKSAQLVAQAFIGPAPFEGAEVCHNDGVSSNDHHSNLRWDSHASNMLDASKHRVERKARSRFPLSREKLLSAQATQFLGKAGRS
jgi:hypothetical protein